VQGLTLYCEDRGGFDTAKEVRINLCCKLKSNYKKILMGNKRVKCNEGNNINIISDKD